MKNEEAIIRLKGMYGNGYTEQEEALDMAIRALENEQTDGDLISRFRDYQIEWLTSHNDIDLHESEMWIVRFLKDTAECFLKTELPSAEKTAEWIPVRKQKPEDYEEVIATVRYDYKNKQEYEVVTGVRYSKEDGWEWAYEAGSDYWEELEGVIAWMPLPEPYKVK